MRWGIDNEPVAVEVYEHKTQLQCQAVGFIQHPSEPMIGGSPDRLVGEEGGLEVKCPYNTRVHLGYMLGAVLPKEHWAQVQGLLWITGRRWWDFASYDPRIDKLRLALFITRVQRDEQYIERLARAVFAFGDKLLKTLCTIGENP